MSLAVAVTETKGDKPRLVVIGDTEMISNIELARSRSADINAAFALSALEWMAERESVGEQPKVSSIYSLGPNVNVERMIFLPGWLMLITLIGLGVGIWVVRRR